VRRLVGANVRLEICRRSLQIFDTPTFGIVKSKRRVVFSLFSWRGVLLVHFGGLKDLSLQGTSQAKDVMACE
jgi:hypothetical protein